MNGLFATLNQRRRAVGLAMLAGILPATHACFGPFPLTHAVYKANASPGNKIIQTLVFWVFVIIPVYWVAMLVDAIVLNLIDFWTGDTITISSVEEHDGVRVATQSSLDGREVVVTITQGGKVVSEQHITKNAEGVLEARDGAGNYLGRLVKSPVGGVEIVDDQGAAVAQPALAPQG